MTGRNKKYSRGMAPQDEHATSKDRYLVTYADLITLLLGLFVILYASSQVDKDKFKEFSEALSQYFKSKPAQVLEGGDGVLSGSKQGVPEPILIPTGNKTLSQVNQETQSALSKFIQSGMMSVRQSSGALTLVLPEKLLFQSAKAELQTDAYTALDSIASVLKGTNFAVFVDGHTDSQPIRTFQYESNWHLSVARAMNVGYRLIRNGVQEHNFVIRGFGAQKPITANNTDQGKAQNRRVEITISEIANTDDKNNGSK